MCVGTEPEHLLLGILNETDCLPAQVLHELGVTAKQVRGLLRRVVVGLRAATNSSFRWRQSPPVRLPAALIVKVQSSVQPAVLEHTHVEGLDNLVREKSTDRWTEQFLQRPSFTRIVKGDLIFDWTFWDLKWKRHYSVRPKNTRPVRATPLRPVVNNNTTVRVSLNRKVFQVKSSLGRIRNQSDQKVRRVIVTHVTAPWGHKAQAYGCTDGLTGRCEPKQEQNGKQDCQPEPHCAVTVRRAVVLLFHVLEVD
jgi:hypothetical protein